MELKLTHESICINEVVFDEMIEHPVELDCLLPDYCPNIFKVLKCKMVPKITSYKMVGEELVIDGTASIYIVYVSEETNQLRSFLQKTQFSKTVSLKKECENPIIQIHAKTEYVNCRGVNSRRIEIRGTVGICVRVISQNEEAVIADASGMGIQKQCMTVKSDGERLCAAKQFTVREDLELGSGKPAMASVIYHRGCASVNDIKVISNKLIMKGDLLLHCVYTPIEDDAGTQIMDFSIPISQIIDMQGVDERYHCMVRLEVTSIDLEPRNVSDEGNKTIEAEITIMACCECCLSQEQNILSDVYSTTHECLMDRRTIPSRCSQMIDSRPLVCKGSIGSSQESIAEVIDVWCDLVKLSAVPAPGGIRFSGELECCVLAINADGIPVSLEKNLLFEQECEMEEIENESSFELFGEVSSVGFHLSGDGKVELQAELMVCGIAVITHEFSVIGSISVDETATKQKNAAAPLTLYYADKGECVWDIAKRYNTSVTAILQENDIEEETLSQGGMILIPQADE